MKTKEELLKIYSCYLPYALSVSIMGEYIEVEGKTTAKEFELVGVNTDYIEYHEIGRSVNEESHFSDVFPHLWSMDYLTKEIEHKCERFVPIEKFEIGDDDSDIEYDHGNIRLIKDLESISKYNSYHDIQFLPFEAVQRLISWQFNVFGLSYSEFIKKETLKQ